ncbi:uncharacterized protein EURHEDRAFT_514982 [Aspergillus ruber CBS 135680]|uniref:Uncharacterized protein n=1 Tax=Aspergillus ruber (strain CBS 135680) TaxID=1388766 RepID=A0A017SEZ1_ASPRC|nr:uncharacterized protein EURHEDRAFT_514982 [Aspergillus ruber CBS 135680]EYE95548.1 hypothetical protein EURHEDRAFT_514982 [Aspergillus ruber CBS 135680]
MTAAKAGVKPEKTMSSRLMTMGFMQRSAAANKSRAPAEGTRTPESKRTRLSTEASPEPAAKPSSDLEAISAAIAAEEEKRREALSKQAAEAGDTEWVLDYPGVQQAARPIVVTAGSLDDEDDDESYGGRQTYGNFKRKKTGVAYGNPGEEELNEAQLEEKSKLRAEMKQEAKHSGGISGGGGRGGFSGNSAQKKRKHK